MTQTYTLNIPSGHLASRIDNKGRANLVTLCANVVIDDAQCIFGDEYRYCIGSDVYIVHTAPLLTDSRVSVYPN